MFDVHNVARLPCQSPVAPEPQIDDAITSGRTFPFVHASFQSNDDPALRLVVYTPSGKAA